MNAKLASAVAVAVAALAGCPGPKKGEANVPPPPPLILATYQAASLAIGQPDLTTATAPTTCTAKPLLAPYGAAAWDGTRLFVPDTGENRVHVYSGIPTASDATPAFDLGQSNCAAAGSSTTSASELSWPQSVRVAGGKLVVTDSTNHRVLVFSSVPTSAPASASVAVGQAGLTTFATACSASGLNGPQSAFVTPGGKLLVADQNHHRVLVWNSLPTASGTAADLVLGQASKTSCVSNDDPSQTPGVVTAKTLSSPGDVWSDGTRVVVADSGNNRLLVWNAFPTSDGQAADAVIGQTSFSASGSGLTDSKLANPIALASDGTGLFVADAGNHRVLYFPGIPKAGGTSAATVVLGQADFTSGSANAGGGVGAKTLSTPAGVAVIDGGLLVADAGNDRVLLFHP